MCFFICLKFLALGGCCLKFYELRWYMMQNGLPEEIHEITERKSDKSLFWVLATIFILLWRKKRKEKEKINK